jgi:hypothetical protein
MTTVQQNGSKAVESDIGPFHNIVEVAEARPLQANQYLQHGYRRYHQWVCK